LKRIYLHTRKAICGLNPTLMRCLFEDRVYYNKITTNAKEFICNQFSPEAISLKVKKRMAQLGLYKKQKSED